MREGDRGDLQRTRGDSCSSSSWLPDSVYRVPVEILVSPDDGQLIDQGLRNNQPVERVAMMEWQDGDLTHVGDVERKKRDSVLPQLSANRVRERQIEGQRRGWDRPR